MSHFFNSDNFFWKCFDKMADVLILSLLWFLCSLPLITIGAASTALYDTVFHTIRQGEPTPYSRFFRTFKREFRRATPSFLLWGAALFLAFAGYNITTSAAQTDSRWFILAMAYYILMILLLGILSWLFPLLSRYEFTFAQLNRTALQFWFAHLPSSIALAALLALSIELCFQLIFPIFFLPCLEALLASLLVERAFQKHIPPELQP